MEFEESLCCVSMIINEMLARRTYRVCVKEAKFVQDERVASSKEVHLKVGKPKKGYFKATYNHTNGHCLADSVISNHISEGQQIQRFCLPMHGTHIKVHLPFLLPQQQHTLFFLYMEAIHKNTKNKKHLLLRTTFFCCVESYSRSI